VSVVTVVVSDRLTFWLLVSLVDSIVGLKIVALCWGMWYQREWFVGSGLLVVVLLGKLVAVGT
jgi:hypothetical protein